jgi:hypothetical protein
MPAVFPGVFEFEQALGKSVSNMAAVTNKIFRNDLVGSMDPSCPRQELNPTQRDPKSRCFLN